jgi:NitT/TauT family transport system ATP-binding protein
VESQSVIVITKVKKSFDEFRVIDDFSLSIKRGSITSILAPSGAGKTTLLRIISGLERSDNGTVFLDGQQVVGPTPEIGFMFQEPSAFPWLTVKQNIEFGLRLRANKYRLRTLESSREIQSICSELDIERVLDLYPSQLSGGQKQRVVIARSLILKPQVILCDEPFSALDEITRSDLRELLLKLHDRYLPTIVFITHSIEEAIFLGDALVICSGPPLRSEKELEIDFERSRDAALLTAKEFLNLKVQVKSILSQSDHGKERLRHV